MKLYQLLIFIGTIGIGACQNATETDSFTDDENNYKLIRDNLYEDMEGNLFFRTLDRSAADDPMNPEIGMVFRYNKYLYVDSVAGENSYLTTPELKDVVDPKTFHQVEGDEAIKNDSTARGLEVSYYEDKNNRYFLLHVADGGTLHKN